MSAKKKRSPRTTAAGKAKVVYIVQGVGSGVNCFHTVEEAISGAKAHCASYPHKGDLIVYKLTPLHIVSPTTGAKVSAAGALTIEPTE